MASPVPKNHFQRRVKSYSDPDPFVGTGYIFYLSLKKIHERCYKLYLYIDLLTNKMKCISGNVTETHFNLVSCMLKFPIYKTFYRC